MWTASQNIHRVYTSPGDDGGPRRGLQEGRWKERWLWQRKRMPYRGHHSCRPHPRDSTQKAAWGKVRRKGRGPVSSGGAPRASRGSLSSLQLCPQLCHTRTMEFLQDLPLGQSQAVCSLQGLTPNSLELRRREGESNNINEYGHTRNRAADKTEG